MTGLRTWEDAAAAAEKLGASEWCLARILGLVPLLWPETLQVLSGLAVPTVYASLARLQQLGLVDSVERTWRPGRNPRLSHLTDLGVAVVADAAGCEPGAFATKHHLRGRDLKAALAGLPLLIKLYELLASVLQCLDGFQQLLAWQPPSPRMVRSSTGKSSFSVSLPAYVRVLCEPGEASWLLLVDTPDVPFDYCRLVLQGVARAGRRWGAELPRLVIRTAHETRASQWDGLVHDAHITWSGPPVLSKVAYRPSPPAASRDVLTPGGHRDELVPVTVSRASQAQLALAGHSAAGLQPAELHVLDLLARHAFLTASEVAIFGELDEPEAGAHLRRLLTKGLVERLVDELTPAGCPAMYEATFLGLHLAAARLGLSLRAAVRFCHLAGGGREQPVGGREGLAATIDHTHGVNATFAEFALTSRVTSRISGDGLLRWESEGGASDVDLRPDGYGVYRLDGTPYGFFLEFDRGTVHSDRYGQKLEAYYRYRQEGRWRRRYRGKFPCLLFVTTEEEAEERFARAALAAGAGHLPPLTIWLTTEARIHASDNRWGAIGRIWRRPEDHPQVRRRWPADSVSPEARSA